MSFRFRRAKIQSVFCLGADKMMNSGKPNKIKVGSSLPAKKPKKVDISKILRDVETTIVELNQMKKFCTDRCQTLLKGISEAYWDCRDRRKEIGDKLAELNYAGRCPIRR